MSSAKVCINKLHEVICIAIYNNNKQKYGIFFYVKPIIKTHYQKNINLPLALPKLSENFIKCLVFYFETNTLYIIIFMTLILYIKQ